ncbi:MAG: caib/baif family protein [Myxococcales bacterium]|nr:caib/baif family protein [Myxococcales bacterium]
METLDARSFTAALKQLERTAQNRGNPGSFESTDCRNSTQCMFCTACADCHACNYATQSEGCSHCTHVARCVQCHQSSHLTDCKRCIGSHYLEHCTDCAECTYCFGCIGLLRKEFHILNQPYDRKTYFKTVKALRAELG